MCWMMTLDMHLIRSAKGKSPRQDKLYLSQVSFLSDSNQESRQKPNPRKVTLIRDMDYLWLT